MKTKAKASTKWAPGPPPKLNAVEVAFPAHAMDWLPPWDAIPDDFKRWGHPWAREVSRWFSEGPDKAWLARLTPATPDIARNDALRCLQACLGSFAPKHEHKIAGAAYLASLWFDDPALTPKEPQP